ncbi:MAG: ABC transporter substrate-binding protein [Chloroflexia bacterium]
MATLSRRALLRGGMVSATVVFLAACSRGSSAAAAGATASRALTTPGTPGMPGATVTRAAVTSSASPTRPVATPGGTPTVGATRTGVTDGEIKLGTWGPQDGPAGVYGVVSRVIGAYFASINAGGGIAGRKITLINENDSYQPTKTATAVRKLVEADRVFALVGGLGAQHNRDVLDYLTGNNVPHIAPATGLGALSRPTRPGIFCVQPSYTVEATLLTRHALDTVGARKLAVFHQDDATGREGLDAVQAELARRGLSAATGISYATGDNNSSAQALRIRMANADALILYAVPRAAGSIIQELARIGVNMPLLASSLINDPSLFELVGPGIEGLIVGSWLASSTGSDAKVGEFQAWMRANLPNERPDDFAAAGYAYATLMAELLRRVGGDLTRERLIATANALQGYTGSLVPSISYSQDDHQGCRALSFQRARFADKGFVRVTEFVELR